MSTQVCATLVRPHVHLYPTTPNSHLHHNIIWTSTLTVWKERLGRRWKTTWMFGGETRSCCVMMHLEKLQHFFGERNVVHTKDALINHGSHQPALFFSCIYTFGMRNTLLHCEYLLEMNKMFLYLSDKQLREFQCGISSFCFWNFENSRKKFSLKLPVLFFLNVWLQFIAAMQSPSPHSIHTEQSTVGDVPVERQCVLIPG